MDIEKNIILVKITQDGFDSSVLFNKDFKYLRAVNFRELSLLMNNYEEQIKEVIVEEVLGHEIKDYEIIADKAKELGIQLYNREEGDSGLEESFFEEPKEEETTESSEKAEEVTEGITEERKDDYEEAVKKKDTGIVINLSDYLKKSEHDDILEKSKQVLLKNFQKKEDKLISEMKDLKEKIGNLRKEKAEIEEQQLNLLDLSSKLEQDKNQALAELEDLVKEKSKFTEKENRLNAELREALLSQEELLGEKNSLSEQLKEMQGKLHEVETKSVKLMEVVQVLQKREEKAKEEYQDKVEVLEQKINDLDSAYDELQERYDSLKQEKRILEQQLNTGEKTQEAFVEEKGNCEAREELQEQKKQLDESIKALEKRKEEIEQNISKLKNTLQNAKEAALRQKMVGASGSLSETATDEEWRIAKKAEEATKELHQKMKEVEYKLRESETEQSKIETELENARRTATELDYSISAESNKAQTSYTNGLADSERKKLRDEIQQLKEKLANSKAAEKKEETQDKLVEQSKKLREELWRVQDALNKKQILVDNLMKKINTSDSSNTNYMKKIEELETEVAIQNEQLSAMKEKHERELYEARRSGESKKEASITHMKEILQLKEKQIELKKELDKRESMIEELQDEVRDSLRKRENATNEINEILDRESRLAQAYSKLKKDYEKAKVSTAVGVVANKATWKEDIEYSGKAKIFTFSGSGSRGVTQLLTSVARLTPDNSTVCMVDFNVNNPRLGAVTGKEAILSLPDIKEPMHRTSMGVLLNKGEDYFFSNIDRVIPVVGKIAKKNVTIRYFSGAYAGMNYDKMAAMDLQSILNKLGDTFDYIFIDIGSIDKSSGMSGELLKRLWKVASKNIVITLKDAEDIRNTRLMLNQLNITRMDKSLWVLNFALDSEITSAMQKLLSGVKILIMPLDQSMTPYKSNMFQSKELRSVIGEVADYCFNRKGDVANEI